MGTNIARTTSEEAAEALSKLRWIEEQLPHLRSQLAELGDAEPVEAEPLARQAESLARKLAGTMQETAEKVRDARRAAQRPGDAAS